MSEVRNNHDTAMKLAQKSLVARERGEVAAAERLAREALDYESRAARLLLPQPASEPTRSILYRSAASLAHQAGVYAVACRLIVEGLSGSPPARVRKELEDLLSLCDQSLAETFLISREEAMEGIGCAYRGPYFYGAPPGQPYHRLLELEAWLSSDDPESVAEDLLAWSQMQFRMATSPVLRSDAQLLGIPPFDFGLRAYLRDELGFVNVRRSAVLARRLASVLDDDSLLPTPFSDLIQQSTCIADSVLCAPPRLASRYHVLSADLASVYGEEKPIRGTPFVRLMKLGAGLCAQSACFIATLLCREHARSVHAPGEITAESQSATSAGVDYVGLNDEQVLSYFRRIGLNGFVENSMAVDANYADWYDRPPFCGRQVHQALSAYLESGFPVILLCDLGRLAGHRTSGIDPKCAVYAQLPRSPGIEHPDDQRHCVVLVGCAADGRPTFLMNDPATLPFLEATLEQLHAARLYKGSEPAAGLRDIFTFISVLPRNVRLPLLTAKNASLERSGRLEPGLLSVAMLARRLAVQAGDGPAELGPLTELAQTEELAGELRFHPECECYRLVDLRAAVSSERGLPAGLRLPDWVLPNLVPQVAGLLPNHSWAWIQFSRGSRDSDAPSSVWVWDAERSAAGGASSKVQDYLLGALRIDPQSRRGEVVYAKPQRASVLRPALISSYVTSGIDRARELWPREPHTACELYAWMFPGQEPLLEGLGIPVTDLEDAVRVMAYLSDKDDRIAECAERVTRKFGGDESHPHVPVVGLATFIPELVSDREDRRDLAKRAVAFLAKFAKAIRRPGHPCQSVELVAGSRLCSLKVLRTTGRNPFFHAPTSNDRVATDRLIEVLRDALDQLPSEVIEGTVFALEMRAGPFSLLRDGQSLLRACEILAADPLLSRIVGIHLNVDEFRRAGITPDWIERTIDVRDRVVHASISGPSVLLHSREEWSDWIRLLDRISLDPRPQHLLAFNNFVALEYAAAPNASAVMKSVLALNDAITVPMSGPISPGTKGLSAPDGAEEARKDASAAAGTAKDTMWDLLRRHGDLDTPDRFDPIGFTTYASVV